MGPLIYSCDHINISNESWSGSTANSTKLDSVISVSDNDFSDFPPKHPMWTIQCMQQDGRILVQNLRRIDASSDGVIPEGVRGVSTTFVFIIINYIY